MFCGVPKVMDTVTLSFPLTICILKFFWLMCSDEVTDCVLPNLCSLDPDFLSKYFCILLLHGKNLFVFGSDSLRLNENLMNSKPGPFAEDALW